MDCTCGLCNRYLFNLLVVLILHQPCFDLGVVLAYVTDEGYSLLVEDEEVTTIVNVKKRLSDSHFGIDSTKINLETVNLIIVAMRQYLPDRLIKKFDSLVSIIQKGLKKYQFYYEGLRLKRIARTKSQLFYMLGKRALNAPIVEGETEIDSYVECKNKYGDTWAFMWEVDHVKKEKIECSGYECVPMSSYRLGYESD